MKNNHMNVLVVGSGGREHALAWKISQSPRLGRLFCAPGNPGTALHGENVPIPALAVEDLVNFACQSQINLAVIGPEAALEAGLSDSLRSAGIPVFGPSRSAAQIETSKSFAKDFMWRHNIPTARYAVFQDASQAHVYLDSISHPMVIKASGLAAGKGVLIPANLTEAHAALDHILVGGTMGKSGLEVIIEERLAGEEISFLGFTDGNYLVPMPPSQDHKRLLDGDRGPNTGGMGAYTPVPHLSTQLREEILRTVMQPAVDGLRNEGMPFQGVLYAGLMLAPEGVKVLEFNARFGDPETQAVLPLMESDLLDVLEACACGSLERLSVHWKPGSSVCVVLASRGYPERAQIGETITGLDALPEEGVFFHAGTTRVEDQICTAGGRVLGVTCWAADLETAVGNAYQAIEQVKFEGMQYRHDIAARALSAAHPSAYAAAGVSIDAGNKAVTLMSQSVRSTYNPAVLAGIGAFGGLLDASTLKDMQHPVLVASTDGVGTKVKLAAQLNRYDSIGIDLVNHCINDILVQGARPLFFLDYFASAKINPADVAEVVHGLAEACRAAGIPLLGGETAEMPGVYLPGEFDLAGTIVGVLERDHILPRHNLQPGDQLVGFRSSGPHTNGYSLIRRVFASHDLSSIRPDLGCSLADALLAPHRSYLNLLIDWIEMADSPIQALAHLTGGGFIENIPRILPQGLEAHIRQGSWRIPPIFQLIQKEGGISNNEMHRVFNMGIGIVAVIKPDRLAELQSGIPEETWVIGELSAGDRKVVLI